MISIVLVFPILIYHLSVYHPEEFSNHGIGFLVYAFSFIVVKIFEIINDDDVFNFISLEVKRFSNPEAPKIDVPEVAGSTAAF